MHTCVYIMDAQRDLTNIKIDNQSIDLSCIQNSTEITYGLLDNINSDDKYIVLVAHISDFGDIENKDRVNKILERFGEQIIHIFYSTSALGNYLQDTELDSELCEILSRDNFYFLRHGISYDDKHSLIRLVKHIGQFIEQLPTKKFCLLEPYPENLMAFYFLDIALIHVSNNELQALWLNIEKNAKNEFLERCGDEDKWSTVETRLEVIKTYFTNLV